MRFTTLTQKVTATSAAESARGKCPSPLTGAWDISPRCDTCQQKQRALSGVAPGGPKTLEMRIFPLHIIFLAQPSLEAIQIFVQNIIKNRRWVAGAKLSLSNQMKKQKFSSCIFIIRMESLKLIILLFMEFHSVILIDYNPAVIFFSCFIVISDLSDNRSPSRFHLWQFNTRIL